MRTQAERIAALEVEVRTIKNELRDINTKLDTILSLKNKGLGAFWLASSLMGTGLIGAIFGFIQWIKG